MTTILSLTPSTRALNGKLKVSAAEALALTSGTSLIVARRDNGPKEPATTVFIVGADASVGAVLTARSSKNNMAYGPITVLEILTPEAAATSTVKAALFVYAGTIEPKVRKAKAVATVTVVKAKDGSVVADGLSKAKALEMIAKAKAGKKAALRIAA